MYDTAIGRIRFSVSNLVQMCVKSIQFVCRLAATRHSEFVRNSGFLRRLYLKNGWWYTSESGRIRFSVSNLVQMCVKSIQFVCRLAATRHSEFVRNSGFSDVIPTSVSQKRLMVHFWKCQRSTLRIVISQNACKSHSIRMSFRSYETFGICRKSDLPVRSRTLTGVIRTSSTTDMDVIR